MRQSGRVESDLVAHIAEVDERRLYAREASPSMFAYCTEVLHLSEAEAYLRIAAARASREHPMLLAMLGEGRLHLTGIAKLAPHLTRENRDALLKRATHRSKRQIEELIAELAPRPDVPAVMRKLPERRTLLAPALPLGPDRVAVPVLELRPDAVASPAPAPAPPAIVQLLAPARYRVQFTASAELHDKLERLRALMRSEVPDGDLATIIEQAVTLKLERLEARRFARTKAPRKGLSETTPNHPRATSRPPSGVPCVRATATAVATWTSRAADAPSATGSSSTTGTRLAWAGTTARRRSASCVTLTTSTWPSTTTARQRWPGGVQGTVCPKPRSSTRWGARSGLGARAPRGR